MLLLDVCSMFYAWPTIASLKHGRHEAIVKGSLCRRLQRVDNVILGLRKTYEPGYIIRNKKENDD